MSSDVVTPQPSASSSARVSFKSRRMVRSNASEAPHSFLASTSNLGPVPSRTFAGSTAASRNRRSVSFQSASRNP